MNTGLSTQRENGASSSGGGEALRRGLADVDSAAFRKVREAFLSTGKADDGDVARAGIAPALLDSWRRCLRYGLNSHSNRAVNVGEVDVSSPLVRLADSVVSTREAVLEQSMSGLSLTDADGLVLRQWVGDPALGRWFDQHDIVPSVSVDESAVGTTSGICLLNEHPTMIRGLEHFYDDYSGVTSAGVPVVHPVTRRIVGSLNLTSRYSDTSPVLLAWVMDLVRDIQNAFLQAATRRERALLNAYLTENRDSRHPLMALNDQTIITNATAARLITSVDQAMLWEQASRAIRGDIRDPRQVVLTDGTVVSVQCREVSDSVESAGAVVRIRPVVDEAPRRNVAVRAPGLPGLVGDGSRWRDLCRRAAAAGQEKHILIVGEQGTGKTDVARAMAGDRATVLDTSACADRTFDAWIGRLGQSLESDTESSVVIRRIDQLTEQAAAGVAELIRLHRRGPCRVFATTTQSAHQGHLSRLHAEFPVVLAVPALRDRLEDLPALLDALTRVVGDRLGRDPTPVRWMPDAVQALSRLDWNGNVAELETVVLRVLQGTSNRYVNAADLPSDVVANASRRRLVGLEHVEAQAITAALREARGNKHRAAESLGIARSTLYRKIRTLGIDLSTAAF